MLEKTKWARFRTSGAFYAGSDDTQHVLYRLLVVVPFPAAIADALPTRRLPLTRALGALFDATVLPAYHLRPLANVWCRWAAKHVWNLAAAWRRATGAPSAPRRTFSDGVGIVQGR